jgi:hypothetical protein
MRYTELLAEMTAPYGTPQQGRYYHGTASQQAANSILGDGYLKGAEVQGRSQLSPVANRVYLTPSLEYAIIYALGGVFMGHDMPETRMDGDRRSGYFGFLFVIDGKDLHDIQPDEDSVGSWLSDNGDGIYEQRIRNGQTYNQLTDYKPKFDREDPRYYLWYRVRRCFTDKQFWEAMQGVVAYQAAGGKRALKMLNDQDKLMLINDGSHVSHAGQIGFSECWRIDKRRSKELTKDGSNFFDIAERMPV